MEARRRAANVVSSSVNRARQPRSGHLACLSLPAPPTPRPTIGQGMGFVRVAGASVAGLAAALVLGSVGAFAYASGSLGYDISYVNCGTAYPTNVRLGAPPKVKGPLPAHVGRAEVQVSLPQSSSRTAFRTPLPFVKAGPGFGIVGVNSGYPFMSTAHPGNPCLLHEYNHTPMAGLYVNTGYDPIYTDANHTTADCTAQSAGVAGSASQQAAWAVG